MDMIEYLIPLTKQIFLSRVETSLGWELAQPSLFHVTNLVGPMQSQNSLWIKLLTRRDDTQLYLPPMN